jgi:hypothetical protein
MCFCMCTELCCVMCTGSSCELCTGVSTGKSTGLWCGVCTGECCGLCTGKCTGMCTGWYADLCTGLCLWYAYWCVLWRFQILPFCSQQLLGGGVHPDPVPNHAFFHCSITTQTMPFFIVA